VLNPILTLTLVLRAEHNNVFHCLGLARLRRDARFNPSSPQTHQKLTFIQLVFNSGVIGELLGHCRTNSQKKKGVRNGRIATSYKSRTVKTHYVNLTT